MLKSGEEIQSSDVLNSELIRRLSEQRVTLRAQLAEQSSSLLDNHPRIKELRAQIADLDQQIRHEAETVARSLENDAKLASARVDAQMAVLDQFKNQAANTNGQDVQLRALEREAKSQRDLLESYLAKYREASARDTIASAPPDARIISRAIGVERAGLSEEAAHRADRHLRHLRGLLRHRGDARVPRQSGKRRRRARPVRARAAA